MSKDLVVRQEKGLAEPDSAESVARIEAMKDQLPALVEAADTDAIKRLRAEGNAASILAKRLGYRREAVALARHSVYCSAALGELIGLGRAGSEGEKAGTQFRALGAAMTRNGLQAVLDACGPIVTDQRAAAIAVRLGYARVSREKMRALLKTHHPGQDLNQVLRSHDLDIGRWKYLAGSGTTGVRRTMWWNAYELLSACGVPRERILELPLAPLVRRNRYRKERKWLTHKFRPGDGRWDEAAVRFTALRDEMTRADEGWSQDGGLYEAMKTVSNIIQREIRAAEKSG